MEFIINKDMLKMAALEAENTLRTGALFYQEEKAFPGVNKIAQKVMKDVELVFGYAPTKTFEKEKLGKCAILYGTVDNSPILHQLENNNQIDLSDIKGKREVYMIQIIANPFEGVEKALLIAGSDKRGTIYGLFHVSKLLGVSPLVNWSNVMPQAKNSITITKDMCCISKEPSIRYRGFFINDEWPAFGNWTMKRFGGFNATMYDQVFELLLRLKGNYLWPAMWSSRFSDDGPGLANAELADEYGVVMGASHHEPCLRYGEEYKYVRGKDSIYGDAWNFKSNREGIIRFWEDGLKRSGKFENVITIGMRGEADTAIMGHESTLSDNINLLRDVINTQNQLIKENINPNLQEVPRMLALYKEVEPFFYGDKDTPGLINSQELEDVILMFCDDNHGNLRTLPTQDMLSHKGGYGMYYHFDYHGGPISYEWINSTYLPKVWEQMSMAYDFGIRDLWIVNVGDIATNEFPLSYFLDLAYDFDTWGTTAINKTDLYTKQWINTQFSNAFQTENLDKIYELITGYTKIAHNRRPEAMNAFVYHPVNYMETDSLLQRIDYLLAIAEDLYNTVDKQFFSAFYSLAYYPAVGNLNLQKMQLLTGKNHYAAKLGMVVANKLSNQIQECYKRDRELVEEYHRIDSGKWYGMGLSEHIGFVHWNEEECQNPILMHVIPANKPRLLVSINGSNQHSEGSSWHNNTLYLDDFLQPNKKEAFFTISSISDKKADYEITCNKPWIICSKSNGSLDGFIKAHDEISVKIDHKSINGDTEGRIKVQMSCGLCTIIVKVSKEDYSELPAMTFVETNGYIAIEAEHYSSKSKVIDKDGVVNEFQVIHGYGKTLSAMKAFPTTKYFKEGLNTPYLEYRFFTMDSGNYELEIYMQPSNPVSTENKIYYGLEVNNEEHQTINIIPEGYYVGDSRWAENVLNNIRKHRISISCNKGLNTVRIYAGSPGFVLEKLLIYPKGKKVEDSYLGPSETYYLGK